MSLTNFPGSSSSAGNSAGIPLPKVTMPALQEMKRQGKPISALTAYDYSTARLVDEAGIDLILVGDSLAQVVLGHDNTLAVTVDEMLHHTRAVRRAVRRALVVADMPFGSYHGSVAESVRNAVRFIKEAGAEAVKIEGPRVELVRELVDSEIPVVAHLGLTPQSVHRMGGYRVQARTTEAAARLRADAHALAEAGAGVLVLEGVPREVAARITAELSIPTIGIGAGPDCDGQILVFHDLVNLTFAPASQVCPPLRRCRRVVPHRHRKLSRRRGASRVPVRQGELPSARGAAQCRHRDARRRRCSGEQRRAPGPGRVWRSLNRLGASYRHADFPHRQRTACLVARGPRRGQDRRPGPHHGSAARGARFAHPRRPQPLRRGRRKHLRQSHAIRAQ